MQSRPVLPLLLAVLALGSLAVLKAASGPEPFHCQAEASARADPEPGFVTLAGRGDPICMQGSGKEHSANR